LELVNVDTGKRAVRAVERCDTWHARAPTDVMPDLFIDWERSAPVEKVTSPKTGLIHIPYTHWRTGDHRPAGMLLARARELPGGKRLAGLSVEDIGPSIAARLGVTLKDVDGVARAWMAEREGANRATPAAT
jgi:hypothetical protein